MHNGHLLCVARDYVGYFDINLCHIIGYSDSYKAGIGLTIIKLRKLIREVS